MTRILNMCFLLFVCNAGLASFSFGASAHCDFNSDGFDDIAVGIPSEDVDGIEGAGAVQVMYGRGNGLSATNNQFWHLDSPNILGDPHQFNSFGLALACGDFNGDNRDDLAIGIPGQDVDSILGAGAVTVLYSSSVSGRLSGRGNQLWSQNTPGVLETAEQNDNFGSQLAAGDFNGDGFADLAIAADGEDIGGKDLAGGVNVLYGSSAGLSAGGDQFWTRDSPGILGEISPFDGFGESLVAADFGRDTSAGCYDDLAIAAPSGPAFDTGSVNVIYGSASGLTSVGNQLWQQSEEQAEFGSALTAGNFRGLDSICGRKKIADLVVSSPFSSFGGSVFVIYGTDSGLTNTDSQTWTQESPGIADQSDEDGLFGFALATGHSTVNGEYLVIGVPREGITKSLGTVFGTGAIHILYTDPATGLLTGTGSKFYHQDTSGIKDTVEEDDQFGFALLTGDFNADGEDDVVVGVPFEDLNGIQDVGSIHVLYSAGTSFTQFFHQNSVDIKDVEEPEDRFGQFFPK